MDETETSLRAGEFVLGLLSPDEHREVARALSRDPGLRAEVQVWEQHMPALFGSIEEVAPPPRVKAQLQTRLFGEERRSLWEELRAPENRGFVAVALAVKAGLVAILLYLLL